MTRLVALLMLFVTLAACGIPMQSEPEALDLEIRPVAVPPVVEPSGPDQSIVYLVRDEGLVPVARRTADDAAGLLELLLAGPTLTEEQTGLRSAIPANTLVLGVERNGNTIVVDLSESFANIGGVDEILAVGQIVVTLTTDTTNDVSVLLEGSPVAVPLPDGALATEPVSVADYQVLLGE
jgi:spore germination protein GerM